MDDQKYKQGTRYLARENGGLAQGSSEDGEKQTDQGYILKVELER